MRREILAAMLGVAVLAPALATERVADFHSAIRIKADGVLEVTERIVIEHQGKPIQRGLVRDFPTRYRVHKVLRNGSPEAWSTEGHHNGVRMRIGRADAPPALGTHVYEITYATARKIGHFADRDELYWNVNGNGWAFRLDHISAEVQLPGPVPARELRGEAYTGPQGARGHDYRYMVRDGAVGFTSTAPFGPHEGMTIVVAFPKGIVAEPGFVRRAGGFLAANSDVAAGVGGLLLLALFFTFARTRERARRAPPRPASAARSPSR